MLMWELTPHCLLTEHTMTTTGATAPLSLSQAALPEDIVCVA